MRGVLLFGHKSNVNFTHASLFYTNIYVRKKLQYYHTVISITFAPYILYTLKNIHGSYEYVLLWAFIYFFTYLASNLNHIILLQIA